MAMQNLGPLSSTPPRPGEAYAQETGKKKLDPSTPPREVATTANHLEDRAEISTSARRLVDLRAAYDAGRRAAVDEPDVRAEKVAQARERLASGFYHSAAVRDKVAEKLVGVFGGLERL